MCNTSMRKQRNVWEKKSLLRSRRLFPFSVPTASTESMQRLYLRSRIPPVASLILLPWQLSICYRFTLQPVQEKHRIFSRFFLESNLIFAYLEWLCNCKRTSRRNGSAKKNRDQMTTNMSRHRDTLRRRRINSTADLHCNSLYCLLN